MRQQPKFTGRALIPNWVLNQLCARSWNVVGEDGIDPRVEDDQLVIGIAPEVLGASAGATICHPFKLWTRDTGSALQYAINDGLMSQDGTFDSSTAGTIILPGGTATTVPALGWTSITATTTLYLHFSVTAGAMAITMSGTPGSNQPAAVPALFDLPIGTVTVSGAFISARNTIRSMVNLAFALIPAWYANRDVTKKQYLVALAGAMSSWQTPGSCVTGS